MRNNQVFEITCSNSNYPYSEKFHIVNIQIDNYYFIRNIDSGRNCYSIGSSYW